MKKRFSFLKISTGVLVLVLALAVLALKKVDYQPYYETEYYTSTRARLDSVLAGTRPVEGPLLAGFGRVSLTPDTSRAGFGKSLPLAGYGKRRGKAATGVHDSLFIKAIALRVQEQTAVLLSQDALIMHSAVTERVNRLLKERGVPVAPQQVLYSATHSHSSIGGWGDGVIYELFAGPYDARVVQWWAEQVVAAIERALADMTPARYALASFPASAFVRNRLVGSRGRIDSTFSLLAVRQQDGDLALAGAYAAHATVLPPSNIQFSGDYPGYWQRRLENELGEGTHAVFFAGAVGSHSPYVQGGQPFDQAEALGTALADSVLRYLPKLAWKQQAVLASLFLPIDLPELHARLTTNWRFRPALARRFLPITGTELRALRLGELLWVGTPCDFSGELAIDLRNHAAVQGFQAVISSFNGSYIGYVIPGHYYRMHSYESFNMSFFGPYMGPYLNEMVRRALDGLMRY